MAETSISESHTSCRQPWAPSAAATKSADAVETVIAAMDGDEDALIDEAADLVFHLMVLLRSSELALDDVLAELARRHRQRERQR